MDGKRFSSRRKACEACVRCKRRCDMKQPCTRCTRRHVECHYPNVTTSDDSSPAPSPRLDWSGSTAAEELTLINGVDRDYFMAFDASMPLYDTLATIVSFKISQPALRFCEHRLRSCSSTLVKTGATPFIKLSTSAHLDSSPIQEAFSAAASYVSRNPQNEELVSRLLIAKTRDLLRAPHWSFDEHLANAQALLLLRIILLFDGDVQMSVVAEATSELVQDRIMSLLQRKEDEAPVSLATSAWTKWTFYESVRRTYLMYVFVEAIFAHIKQGYCELVPLLSTLPLAVEGSLWTAKTEQEWLQLTKHRSPAVITYSEAVPIWSEMRTGEHRNLETMQEMLLTACRGEIPHLRRDPNQQPPITSPAVVTA